IFDVPLIESVPDWDGAWSMTTHNHGITDATPYVAMSAYGETFVVGGDNYNSNQGRIRIHQLINGSWAFQQQVIGISAGSYYGRGIDITENGDVIAVGAYDQGNTGYVYIYRHNGSSWVSDQTFRNSNYAMDDFYGYAVSLSDNGNRLAVGAIKEDGATNSITDSGAVFIHDYDGSNWSEIAVVRASDAESGDVFGRVALNPDGDKLMVVAANGYAAYLYDLSSLDVTDWQATEQIFASPGVDDDYFGVNGYDFRGGMIALGANYDDNAFSSYVSNTEIDGDFNGLDSASVGTFDKTDNSVTNSGATYLIRLDGNVLSSVTPLQARIDA
ncbi:hypothetical protein F8B77_17305, partial [Aliivibrio finisterrensis]